MTDGGEKTPGKKEKKQKHKLKNKMIKGKNNRLSHYYKIKAEPSCSSCSSSYH